MKNILLFLGSLIVSCNLWAQNSITPLSDISRSFENLEHEMDEVKKQIDDILWFQRLGDVAWIDKVIITGPPRSKIKNPQVTGASNPLKFYCYVFIPRWLDLNGKYPLIVLPHGGVHADFTTYHTHIVKELMAQGYIVVAPEYRGSTGYGRSFYECIDYGGLEIEDCHASRNYMIENYPFVDGKRVGILGWSHGGLIALMMAFEHPEDYAVVYAGVPVSDLIARIGYHGPAYEALFSADYHIGQTVAENTAEYRRRSPAWNALKLKTPLLIHTNTNDDDVNVLEVEHLIKSLKAEGKKFEYEIFKDVEGGHSFDRIDTRKAREIRLKIYGFFTHYLNPPYVLKTVEEINRAAYYPR